jgi:cytochrome c553
MSRRAVSNRWAGRAVSAALAAALLALPAAAATPAAGPSFTRDIKGILSNRCVRCHGPDAEDRHGGGDDGLRLDTFAGATADLGGHAAIVPWKPDESAVIARITSADPDLVMPPPEAGERLPEKQVDLLRRWITAGATYERHWAYVPPTRSAVPAVNHAAWPENDIDRFILARLEAEGLAPQPEADRATLARRLALDLTGLPMPPEEIDAFVADPSPDAVGKLVDRLLAHPGYGEHMARQWLDLARYADSAGYADDPHRTIWGWRDWVIRAFDANMPFDEFTIKQLAGDLQPNATLDDRVATAFHRNTLTNNEGGTIDEEFRTVAVIDRVNTTMSTWMGTTMACAQCHDHKYDPLSQKEYFQLYAVLNNTADADLRDEAPVVEIPWASVDAPRDDLKNQIATIEAGIPELAKPAPTDRPEPPEFQPARKIIDDLRAAAAKVTCGTYRLVRRSATFVCTYPAALRRPCMVSCCSFSVPMTETNTFACCKSPDTSARVTVTPRLVTASLPTFGATISAASPMPRTMRERRSLNAASATSRWSRRSSRSAMPRASSGVASRLAGRSG